MKKTTIKILAVFVLAFTLIASLFSCDAIGSAIGGNDTQSPTFSESEGGSASDEVSASTTGKETASATESENDTATGSEGTTGGQGGALEESERFDYSSADMSNYIFVDEKLYKNTTVTLPSYFDGSDEAVNKFIQLLCENNATSTGNKIVDRAIQQGDTVALYYEGWLNGEKFAGGSNMSDANPYMLTIGSGAFIPGFEDALVGIVPNETSKDNLRDLHLTFPESYHSADLAGKAVIFKVYVEYIDEIAPAEYNEEFITKTLQFQATSSDVKGEFEKYLKEEYLPETKKSETIQAIWLELASKCEIKSYPQSELDFFFESYSNQYNQYYLYYSYMFSSFEDFMAAYMGANWKADLETTCKADVAQNLVFHYIAQKENIVISDDDIKEAIQYYVDYYSSEGQSVTAEQVEKELGERILKEQALWDNVNEFLLNNCTVKYD